MAQCLLRKASNAVVSKTPVRTHQQNVLPAVSFQNRIARNCGLRHGDSRRITISANAATSTVTEAELTANKQRWLESGGGKGNVDDWRWSLNWDQITDDIVVGSCPRSTEDLDRLVDEAKIDSIVSLQSDICLDAMSINWLALRERGLERNIILMRVPTRDFDRHDQTLMLPEAVKAIALLVGLGKRVYVHCTAGINRAPLAVVGYLTFVKGMSLKDAERLVKSTRPQANPYIDCWKAVRNHFLEGETEQVGRIAQHVYKMRQEAGNKGDGVGDWVQAEDLVVRDVFQRQLAVTLALVSSLKDLEASSLQSLTASHDVDLEAARSEMARMASAKEDERQQLMVAQQQLTAAKQEIAALKVAAERQAASNQLAASAHMPGVDSVLLKLNSAQREIGTLKAAIRNMAIATYSAMSVAAAVVPEGPKDTEELSHAAAVAVAAVEALSADAQLKDHAIGAKPLAYGNGNGRH